MQEGCLRIFSPTSFFGTLQDFERISVVNTNKSSNFKSHIYPVSSPKLLLAENLEALIANTFIIPYCCCNSKNKGEWRQQTPPEGTCSQQIPVSLRLSFSNYDVEELDWSISKVPSVPMFYHSTDNR